MRRARKDYETGKTFGDKAEQHFWLWARRGRKGNQGSATNREPMFKGEDAMWVFWSTSVLSPPCPPQGADSHGQSLDPEKNPMWLEQGEQYRVKKKLLFFQNIACVPENGQLCSLWEWVSCYDAPLRCSETSMASLTHFAYLKEVQLFGRVYSFQIIKCFLCICLYLTCLDFGCFWIPGSLFVH